MWKSQRRKKLFATPSPADWRRIVETSGPFYHELPEPDRRELEGHTRVFLAEKSFEGCGGLKITDEIRIGIASQACVLLLHRQTDYFPRLRTVLVYPSSYYATTIRQLGAGVIEESQQARAGEAWPHGVVVLAWDQVCRTADAGHSNVVLHEFAHQLDFEDGGYADGTPNLGGGESFSARKLRCAAWLRIMRDEYEQLRSRLERGENSLLRPYAGTNPAEFFAVATEAFFGQPGEMRRQLPALYAELKWFYRQDPAQWSLT